MNDRAKVKFFGCNHWETILKVKTHLVAKNTNCACARTVVFLSAIIQHVLHQIEILFHQNVLLFELRKGLEGPHNFAEYKISVFLPSYETFDF